jgi:RecB family exonuclease
MIIKSCSPSRINVADHCDFKYYLSYELDLGDELSASPFASRYGSSVHNILEAFAKANGSLDWRAALLKEVQQEELRPYDLMEKASKRVQAQFFVDKECYSCPFFKDGNCAIVNKKVDNFDGCPKRLHEDALAMIRSAIKRYDKYFRTGVRSPQNPGGKIIGVEHEFTIELGKDRWAEPIIMHGFMDLIVEDDPETLIVADYKTGFKTYSTEELMHDMQARMYSVAAKREFPNYKYVLLTFDYFRATPVDVVFTAKQDNVTIEAVKQKWNEIKAKRKIQRRPYDWYCQYLCNRPVCDVEWEKLKAKFGKK